MKSKVFCSALALIMQVCSATALAGEKVVLLHGLGRTPRSMAKMERRLVAQGFAVANIGYPSRRQSIEELAVIVRERIMKEAKGHERVHLVAHSMGAIIVRQIQRRMPIRKLGRVSHTFIMRKNGVIENAAAFLRSGTFAE